MRLHTRISLGYGYLVAIVVLSVVSAAVSFQQLGTRIGRLLDENFRSVTASMHMIEALERQDSALLSSLLEEPASRERLRESDLTFRKNLDLAADNITLEAEHATIEGIREAYAVFGRARAHFLVTSHEQPLQDYERDVFPLFEDVKSAVIHLLDLNHQAMKRAEQSAQHAASSRALALGVLAAVSILSLGFIRRELNISLLVRLRELSDLAQAISRGELRQRAAEDRRDELGALAAALNRILDHQKEAEGRTASRMVAHRQLLLGLMHNLPAKAALLTLAGDLVASTMSDADTAAVTSLAATVAAMDEDDRRPRPLGATPPAGPFTVQSLWVSNLRPVGWLVRRIAEGSNQISLETGQGS